MVIAIDGPAGAGKSTVAKILAAQLGCLYLDTGAMYRALTLKALETGTDINDDRAMEDLARGTKIELRDTPAGLTVLLDGRDVSTAIRQPKVTGRVSDAAKIPGVRSVMVEVQRSLGHTQNCILDGRDIGTVVFPEADFKFFIDAAEDERVTRRYRDFQNLKIPDVTRTQVARDLKNRDTIDSTRACGPLKKAADAIYIDTTRLSIEQVVARMREYITKV